MKDTGCPGSLRPYAFVILVVLGLIFRILIAVLPGNELKAPWSGAGDVYAYVTLAQNLLAGRGFSFGGQPSAYCPPGYPFLLAGTMSAFGVYYAAAVRWLQFALSLATVWLCARASARLFGEKAWRTGLVIALLLPTLAYIAGEVLTECVGAFFSALFLYLLLEDISQPRLATAAGLGCAIGLGSLFRFNTAVLGPVGLWEMLRAKGLAPRWQRAGVLLLVAGLMLAPWVIRNVVVFDGRVLYSTQSGFNAVEGVLAPQGRAIPSEEQELRETPGWVSPVDLLTNNVSRSRLPAEPELNKRAWSIASKLWVEKGWRLWYLALLKVSYFWLSTDQIFWTQGFTPTQRALRAAAVGAYWLVLLLAVLGWFRVRKNNPERAEMLLVYAIVVTLAHVPFVMNTRIRIPLVDPVLAILAAGGWLNLKFGHEESGRPPRPKSHETMEISGE